MPRRRPWKTETIAERQAWIAEVEAEIVQLKNQYFMDCLSKDDCWKTMEWESSSEPYAGGDEERRKRWALNFLILRWGLSTKLATFNPLGSCFVVCGRPVQVPSVTL